MLDQEPIFPEIGGEDGDARRRQRKGRDGTISRGCVKVTARLGTRDATRKDTGIGISSIRMTRRFPSGTAQVICRASLRSLCVKRFSTVCDDT